MRVNGRFSSLTARLVGAAVVLVTSVALAQVGDQEEADARRARIPLSDIAGAPPPPPLSVPPLEDVPEVQKAVDQARAWIEDGRFQDVADALTNVLEKPGGDRHEVHYLLALAKTRLGQFSAGRTSAEAAARLGHGDANTHCLLAQILRGQGEIEAAIAHYRSATLAAERELNNSKVTRAWYSLGQLLEQTGYDLAAAEAYAQFDLALWQTHPEQRNAPEFAALLARRPHGMVSQRWDMLMRGGHLKAALQVAEWAHGIWPDDLSVDRLYAQALLSAGQPQPAYTFCRGRLDTPSAADALLPIAVNAARAAEDLDDWLDEVVSRITEGQGLAQARTLTRVLLNSGEPAQAVRIGQALLSQRPADEDVTWHVAAAQQELGDLRGVLETLIAFVRGSPELPEVPAPRLAQWKAWFESSANVADLVKELRARPTADFATDFVLGVSALAANQPELADELLQACMASQPDFAPAYVVQGELLLASYQWNAAKQFAQEILDERPDLVAAHYLLAQAHEGLDENEQAEQAYKQAIKLQPQGPTYTLALAQHYLRLGNLRGAQRYFQETLTTEPGRGPALEGLIDCYLRSGKIEIARSQLERLDRDTVPADALRRVDTLMRFVSDPFGTEHLAELKLQFERYPDDIATARLLAGGLYYRGRIDEARDAIEQVRAKHPDDYHLTILLANIHALRGEFDAAVALLSTLLERFPNRLAVLQPLALAELNDFRLEEGRARLRRLMELDADEADRYRGELLRTYTEFGECDQAVDLIESWRQAEPDSEPLVYQQIEVLIDCEHYDEAFAMVAQRLDERPDDRPRMADFVEYGKQARQYGPVAERLRGWLKDNPHNAALTEELIDVLLLGEHPDEALALAREFEGTYAESLKRRLWMGRCQAAGGEIDTAVTEFEALLNERGADDEVRAEARWQIFITLNDAGRYDALLERCEQWLQQAQPEGDRGLAHEALQYKRLALQGAGRDREYAEVMETLLEYRPDDTGIFNDLGYTWADQGVHLERAASMIRVAAAAEPWNAAFLDSLGWVYYKSGDFSNARKYLTRAIRLRDGQDAVVYDHLADAAYRLGDHDAAREYWTKTVSLLETELSEREQARLTDLLAAVRAKLVAVERSETPALAPTAAEQTKKRGEE